MLTMTHWDGADVVVIDSRGRHVPAVEEVRVEPGFAVVSVTVDAHGWVQDLLAQSPNEPLAAVIRSLDGQLQHEGAIRVACV